MQNRPDSHPYIFKIKNNTSKFLKDVKLIDAAKLREWLSQKDVKTFSFFSPQDYSIECDIKYVSFDDFLKQLSINPFYVGYIAVECLTPRFSPTIQFFSKDDNGNVAVATATTLATTSGLFEGRTPAMQLNTITDMEIDCLNPFEELRIHVFPATRLPSKGINEINPLMNEPLKEKSYTKKTRKGRRPIRSRDRA